MDTNEQNEDIITSQNNDEQVEESTDETTETAEGKEEGKETKPSETPEAKLARLERQAKQLRKKLGKEEPTKEASAPEKQDKSSDLGYGEKAFLKSYGISGSDELALVKQFQARTGDDLDTLVTDEIFMAKLNNLREVRATKEAIPSTNRRSGQVAKDSVDYWMGKPFDEVPQEMRAKVLDARIEKEKAAF